MVISIRTLKRRRKLHLVRTKKKTHKLGPVGQICTKLNMDRCKDVDVYNPRAIKRMYVVSQDTIRQPIKLLQ